MLRTAIAFALIASAFLWTPKSASALPLVLGDHAALSQEIGGAMVEQASRRGVHARRFNGNARIYPRRYDWTYYPYWRPYQYRYWQFYYPYGGPLF